MRAYRPIAPRLVATVMAGLTLLAACGRSHDAHPTIDEARSELRGYIEDITQATASRYAVVDDRRHVMDTVKIIAVPESGGFVGLYHSFREETGTFAVHLATSEDLMNWTWQRQLGDNASMPTIKPASDGIRGRLGTGTPEPRQAHVLPELE